MDDPDVILAVVLCLLLTFGMMLGCALTLHADLKIVVARLAPVRRKCSRRGLARMARMRANAVQQPRSRLRTARRVKYGPATL